jgi:hypothetical protein
MPNEVPLRGGLDASSAVSPGDEVVSGKTVSHVEVLGVALNVRDTVMTARNERLPPMPTIHQNSPDVRRIIAARTPVANPPLCSWIAPDVA